MRCRSHDREFDVFLHPFEFTPLICFTLRVVRYAERSLYGRAIGYKYEAVKRREDLRGCACSPGGPWASGRVMQSAVSN
jgi:hypothetical protein